MELGKIAKTNISLVETNSWLRQCWWSIIAWGSVSPVGKNQAYNMPNFHPTHLISHRSKNCLLRWSIFVWDCVSPGGKEPHAQKCWRWWIALLCTISIPHTGSKSVQWELLCCCSCRRWLLTLWSRLLLWATPNFETFFWNLLQASYGKVRDDSTCPDSWSWFWNPLQTLGILPRGWFCQLRNWLLHRLIMYVALKSP